MTRITKPTPSILDEDTLAHQGDMTHGKGSAFRETIHGLFHRVEGRPRHHVEDVCPMGTKAAITSKDGATSDTRTVKLLVTLMNGDDR